MSATYPASQPFTGAYPTNREFVEQLAVWGFTQRKEEGVHLVFRGPHGGTLRVVRSLLGRADPDRIDKAAGFVGLTPDQFWEGPSAPETAPPNSTPEIRTRPTRDRATALVLSLHAEVDRPLAFDQVVRMASGSVTREKVRSASAQLCSDGDLIRIRRGVYQWAQGRLAQSRTDVPQQADAPPEQLELDAVSASGTDLHPTPAELFELLFPSGVRMTAALLGEFGRWADMTEDLVARATAS